MALFALGDGMHADERKTGEVMVEQYIVVPALLAMAAVALFPLFTVMDVVLAVAADTAGL